MRNTTSEKRLGHSGEDNRDIPMVSRAKASPTPPSSSDHRTRLGVWDALELLEVVIKEDAEAVEVDVLPTGLGHRGAARLGWGGTPRNQQSPGWGNGQGGDPWGITSDSQIWEVQSS